MGSAASDRKAWVKLSVVMSAKDDPLSMPEVQQLCALDLQLCEQEARLAPFVGASLPDTDALAVSFQLTEIGALSWLWVLGAYEVFRRAKNRGGGFLQGTELHSLNEQISEIRIVLAKRCARANDKVRQMPKILLSRDGAVGWGFWDRRLNERQFFRAPFAERWITSVAEFG
jgi:hypothetical protein